MSGQMTAVAACLFLAGAYLFWRGWLVWANGGTKGGCGGGCSCPSKRNGIASSPEQKVTLIPLDQIKLRSPNDR